MTTWRDIPASSIDWSLNPISKRAGYKVNTMCYERFLRINPGNAYKLFHCGGWHDLTLGQVADLGERHWMRCDNIGEKGAQVIKWVIDEAAEGRAPLRGGIGKALDAYVPKSERQSKNINNRPPLGLKEPKAKPQPDYLDAVRGLPCVICEGWGMPQLSRTTAHHPICGRYGTRKAPDVAAIPLCDGHHQGTFDTSKTAIHRDRTAWVEQFGPDTDYIAITQDRLAHLLTDNEEQT